MCSPKFKAKKSTTGVQILFCKQIVISPCPTYLIYLLRNKLERITDEYAYFHFHVYKKCRLERFVYGLRIGDALDSNF
jgi:hypothetical protein